MHYKKIFFYIIFSCLIVFIKLFIITYKLNGLIFLIYFILLIISTSPFIIKTLTFKQKKIIIGFFSLIKEALKQLQTKKLITLFKFIIFTLLYLWLKPVNLTSEIYTLICILVDRFFFIITVIIWIQITSDIIQNLNWYKNYQLKKNKDLIYLENNIYFGFMAHKFFVENARFSVLSYISLFSLIILFYFNIFGLKDQKIQIVINIPEILIYDLNLNLAVFLFLLILIILFLYKLYNEYYIYKLKKTILKIKKIKISKNKNTIFTLDKNTKKRYFCNFYRG